MGSMFRSEEMALCQLFIQPESAYTIVSALGEMGTLQFRDLNVTPKHNLRPFIPEVSIAEEMMKKIFSIEKEIRRDGIKIPCFGLSENALDPKERKDLEEILEGIETQVKGIGKEALKLKTMYTNLKEHLMVVYKAHDLINGRLSDEVERALSNEDDILCPPENKGFFVGVMRKMLSYSFERMLWRLSRGTLFVRMEDLEETIEDPNRDNEDVKTFFIIYYNGESIKNRTMQVCYGFHARVYECPTSFAERIELLDHIRTNITELSTVMEGSAEHRRNILSASVRELESWKMKVWKMKAVYHTMNFFSMDITRNCLIGEAWVPVRGLQNIRETFEDLNSTFEGSLRSFLNIIHTTEEPPTFNMTNKFTKGFQNLIDCYGVGSYREVNPALYTIITFPFLFGVMFGDMGHGLVLLIFAAVMIIKEKHYMMQESKNEIWEILFCGRYIILMMGLFSIYAGFIYNDVFSLSLNIFGSSWKVNYNLTTIQENEFLQLNPSGKDYFQIPYPVGMDPVWQLAENKITFMNSFKMKFAIILGVSHMILGICLNTANHIYFKRPIYLLIQFLPELLFFLCIFLYLAIMLILKWFIYVPDSSDAYRSTACAPSVLVLFINMVMFSRPKLKYTECQPYMFKDQYSTQILLMVVAIICIPVILTARPIYILYFKKRPRLLRRDPEISESRERLLSPMEELESGAESSIVESTEEDAAEVWIHQIIHTIECVLSTVSHTASYLRLWALSLAHTQLSEVLWSRLMRLAFLTCRNYFGSFFIFIIFAAWASLTIGILVLMEGLSAFLHTLRLHWVEFMSKFYSGKGHLFQPFSLDIRSDEI